MHHKQSETWPASALRWIVAGALVGAFASFAACAGDEEEPPDAGDVGVTLTDGQIAEIAKTLNEGEVALGALGLERASSPEVLGFAQLMGVDHGQAKDRLDGIVEQAGIAYEDSAIEDQLENLIDQVKQGLEQASAEEFDRAYMEAQVTIHNQALGLFDDTLIPQARNEALKAELQVQRGAVEEHRSSAQTILDALGGPPDAGVEEPDAGVEEPDAGVEEPDAGVEEPDAGVEEPDAGVEEPDAGVEEPDAGVEEPDAGVEEPDAGVEEPDAGLEEPDAGSTEL